MNSDMVSYYRDRAKEYEKIYAKPERQQDLAASAVKLQHLFSGRDLLEIACGTGYWTEKIAVSAKSIFATDINAEVIEIARQKQYRNNNVRFDIRDLYKIDKNVIFNGIFGGFIWSHVPVEELPRFIEAVHSHVNDDGVVVFMDNSYVEGSNHPITETDKNGNTFQTRLLADGSEHRVLKNFPSKEFLTTLINSFGTDISFTQLEYFWILSYKPII
jgi:cyclopropane fatty-acyl-phospholipid synthase-like methyltransferase